MTPDKSMASTEKTKRGGYVAFHCGANHWTALRLFLLPPTNQANPSLCLVDSGCAVAVALDNAGKHQGKHVTDFIGKRSWSRFCESLSRTK